MSGKARPPVPDKKIIIGIPVLPGLPAFTEHTIRGEEADDTAGTTSIVREEGAWVVKPRSGTAGSTNDLSAAAPDLVNAPVQKWKLQHIDFVPGPMKSKSDDFERFSVLVERANDWSTHHPEALIFSCETMTWMSMDRPIYTDSGVFHKSMNSDKKTRIVRGLRVWYMVLETTFFDRKNCPGPMKLGYVNYSPEGKNDNFGNMLRRLNEDIFKRSVIGKKILKVETLHASSDFSDPDVCSWTEQPSSAKDYYGFLRMFFMLKADDSMKYGELGIKDFFPQNDGRSPHSHGFELFSDIWKRAARWIYLTPTTNVINVQSIFIKFKKDEVSPNSTFWDRCYYKEHGSAYGSMGHTRTEYLQILRVVYGQKGPSPNPGRPEVTPPPTKMHYKCFSPVRLKMAPAPGDDNDQLEMVYEDLRFMEEKINVWLTLSGARVFNVETAPSRLLTGGMEAIGPETTFTYNDREKNIGREYWKQNLRLYIDGDFRELPCVWTTRYIEEKSAGVP